MTPVRRRVVRYPFRRSQRRRAPQFPHTGGSKLTPDCQVYEVGPD
jgi:hypothetical protein